MLVSISKGCFEMIAVHKLIAESEMPERDRIAGSELDVIFDNESIRDTLNLFFPFFTPYDFKCIVLYHEIGNGRGDYIVIHSHLIEKKCFPDISDFSPVSK